ncbi:histidine phosphatase family protein [Jatrophihabitans lederbergiae]|uniref:Histidine phosphatase family protein n=1 Tax=Jatrophihabitans lederbergiae TaxID=3075547 RepID=A0ABU2J5W3_9ACTN|nr:histidine phosphatase family protein [Jatrophihabitans sp. DSM 44399]MDT0260380.1 histidine phosphatase family protein [Jatrophihabitans sp. DSM 44399]
MQRRIVLLRHGRTAWNAERRYQGQEDPPLDEVGQVQAIEAAALVAAMNPDVLISSDLERARQTAQKVSSLSGVPLTVDKRLRERNLGHWQGLTRDEVQSRYPEEFADWLAGRDVARRGGESRRQVAERALSVVDQLAPVPLAVLVSHGATSMCLSAALLGLPQTPSILGPLANCHWTELRNSGDGWTLRAHNAGPPGPVIPLLAPDGDHSDADA